PGTDPGFDGAASVWTIRPTALPTITDPVVIDATTQDGWSAGQPKVVLDGSRTVFSNGLAFTVGGNTDEGLVINNFGAFGILLDGSSDSNHGTGPGLNNIIQGNFIGTDFSGKNAAPNLAGGIKL